MADDLIFSSYFSPGVHAMAQHAQSLAQWTDRALTTSTQRWVMRLKAEKGWANDGQVARELGAFRMTVRRWSLGETRLSQEAATRFEAELGLPRGTVWQEVCEERETAPSRRKSRQISL